MARQSDARNPVFVEQAGVEQLHGVAKPSHGSGGGPGDAQHLADADLPGQLCQGFLQEALAWNAARDKMGHGVETLSPESPGYRDGVVEIRALEAGDVNCRAGPGMGTIVRHLGSRPRSGFEREARHEIHDLLAPILADCGCYLHCFAPCSHSVVA